MNVTYQIATNNFIVSPYYRDRLFVVNDKENFKRIKSAKNHIESGDYFGTLATVLDLTSQVMAIIDQNTKETVLINKRNMKKLEKLRDDLMFLQRNYKIIKKK